MALPLPILLQDGERLLAGERHQAAIAETDIALRRRGVLFLDDCREVIALHHQPAIAGRIFRRKAEHGHRRAGCQRSTQL